MSGVNEAMAGLIDNEVALEVLKKQRSENLENPSINQKERKIVDNEIRRLNMEKAEKAAIAKHREAVAEAQLSDIQHIRKDVLPKALNSGKIESFRGLVPDSLVQKAQTVPLTRENAFKQLADEFDQNLKASIMETEKEKTEKSDALDDSLFIN